MFTKLAILSTATVLLATGASSYTTTSSANSPAVASIPVANDPFWVASNPKGGQLYVTSLSGGVSDIDTRSNRISGPAITEGMAFPFGLAFAPNGHRAFVTNNSNNTVAVIDTIRNKTIATFSTAENPSGVAVSGDSRFLYVVSSRFSNNSGLLQKYRTSDLRLIGTTADLGRISQRLVLTHNGSRAYVTNAADNSVTRINTATMKRVGAAIPTGQYPMGIAALPNNKTLYIANSAGRSVTVISTATDRTTGSIVTQKGPYGVSVSNSGDRVYVVNTDSNSVSVIDSQTSQVLKNIPVGTSPQNIALTPDSSRAYVSNLESNTVSWFRILQSPARCGTKAFPKKLKKRGTTVLLPRTCKTNAGQTVRVSVRATRGESKSMKILRTKGGKVSIKTFGKRQNIKVYYRAKARSIYPAWSKTSRFLIR